MADFGRASPRKALNQEFRQHLAFKKNPCDVIVTLCAATNTVWVRVHPLDAAPANARQ